MTDAVLLLEGMLIQELLAPFWRDRPSCHNTSYRQLVRWSWEWQARAIEAGWEEHIEF